MKALRESLLLRLGLISLIVMTVVTGSLAWNLSRSINETYVQESAQVTSELIIRSVLHYIEPADFLQPMTGKRYDDFLGEVENHATSSRTARIKLWNNQGVVIFSTNRDQVGQVFPISSNLARALNGGIGTEIEEPEEDNPGEGLETLLAVYAPVRFPGSDETVGAFEIYQYYAPIASLVERQTKLVLIHIGIGFILIFAPLAVLVLKGWLTIQKQQWQLWTRMAEIQTINASLHSQLSRRS